MKPSTLLPFLLLLACHEYQCLTLRKCCPQGFSLTQNPKQDPVRISPCVPNSDLPTGDLEAEFFWSPGLVAGSVWFAMSAPATLEDSMREMLGYCSRGVNLEVEALEPFNKYLIRESQSGYLELVGDTKTHAIRTNACLDNLVDVINNISQNVIVTCPCMRKKCVYACCSKLLDVVAPNSFYNLSHYDCRKAKKPLQSPNLRSLVGARFETFKNYKPDACYTIEFKGGKSAAKERELKESTDYVVLYDGRVEIEKGLVLSSTEYCFGMNKNEDNLSIFYCDTNQMFLTHMESLGLTFEAYCFQNFLCIIGIATTLIILKKSMTFPEEYYTFSKIPLILHNLYMIIAYSAIICLSSTVQIKKLQYMLPLLLQLSLLSAFSWLYTFAFTFALQLDLVPVRFFIGRTSNESTWIASLVTAQILPSFLFLNTYFINMGFTELGDTPLLVSLLPFLEKKTTPLFNDGGWFDDQAYYLVLYWVPQFLFLIMTLVIVRSNKPNSEKMSKRNEAKFGVFYDIINVMLLTLVMDASFYCLRTFYLVELCLSLVLRSFYLLLIVFYKDRVIHTFIELHSLVIGSKNREIKGAAQEKCQQII